jgi:oligopeptide transport system ATP-binding protein
MSLLEVSGLEVRFQVRGGFLSRAREWIHAVNGVDLELREGETLGLVGESGCGKSTLGRAVARLLSVSSGTILFEGEDIAGWSEARLRPMRKRLQMIFQDPYGSLDPRLTVGQSIGEAIDLHKLAGSRAEARDRITGLLGKVGLDSGAAHRYPHEFSGGQRQRIGIARALAVEPKLIICDEPVSALDVSIQAQIINLLEDLQHAQGLAYLFIGHDLAVVEHISDRVMVMYLGKVMEIGPAREVCRRPKHPYTQALVSAVPTVDAAHRKRIILEGEVPSPIHPPPGCPFQTRCPIAEDRCRTILPELRTIAEGHRVACHLVK